MRDLFKKLMQDDDSLHAFALWAFGSGYNCKTSIELMNSWNEIHGKDLTLNPRGNPKEDSVLMVALWKSYLDLPKTWENFD